MRVREHNITDEISRPAMFDWSQIGFVSSIAIICIAGIFLNVSIDPKSSSVIGMGCCLASLISLKLYKWPIVFALRMTMLAIPGVLTGMVIILYGTDNIVMVHAARHIYQTYEVTSRVLLLTALALCSSSIAWFLAVNNPVRLTLRLPGENSRFRMWTYAVLAIVAGTFLAKALGPYVWNAVYGSSGGELFLNIGAMPTIAAIGVIGMYSLLLSSESTYKNNVRLFILVSAYTLIHCMFLRGMRLEVFAVGIALYVGFSMKQGLKIKPLKLAAIALTLYFLAQIWGSLRSIAGSGLTIQDALIIAFRFARDDGAAIYFQLGTFADIASTFYNTVGLYDDGLVKPLLGRSYLEYIPRTLPEFLYPDRPKDLSGLFENVGLTSGGGFFELAEAYLNFGSLGCVIVPFSITYLIAQCHINAHRHRGVTTIMLYMFVVSMFLRGIWYQTFVFYKATITWLFLELFVAMSIAILSALLLRRRVAHD